MLPLDRVLSRIQHGNTSSELWVLLLLPPHDSSRIVCLILVRVARASNRLLNLELTKEYPVQIPYARVAECHNNDWSV